VVVLLFISFFQQTAAIEEVGCCFCFCFCFHLGHRNLCEVTQMQFVSVFATFLSLVVRECCEVFFVPFPFHAQRLFFSKMLTNKVFAVSIFSAKCEMDRPPHQQRLLCQVMASSRWH